MFLEFFNHLTRLIFHTHFEVFEFYAIFMRLRATRKSLVNWLRLASL